MKEFIMDVKAEYTLFTILGLIMVLLISMTSCTESKKKPEMGKSIAGAAAPDFSLRDLTGRNFTLSAQRGKPVLLIFITTWCPTCRSEMSHYKSIHEKYSQQGLEVVNIDIQEPKGKVSQFAEKYKVPYKMLLDEKGDVAEAYSIVGVPAMVLVDKDGKIVSSQYLAMDKLLENLLGKK
jgi:peroxiredoxin